MTSFGVEYQFDSEETFFHFFENRNVPLINHDTVFI